MKAIIYARFSDRPNADECDAIDFQIKACTDHCDVVGHTVSGQFYDAGKSGADRERPAMYEAIKATKRGYVLLAHRPDRLARDLFLSEWIRLELQNRGASLEFVKGDAGGDTPEAVLLRQMLAAFAEFERKLIAARTRATMLDHQYRKLRNMSGPHKPYGYEADPDDRRMLRKVPAEQEIIQDIFAMRDRGYSQRETAAYLNTHDPSGRKWNGAHIHRILKRAVILD